MANYKCGVCGGDLILTIGSDTAVCDHCGQARAIDPQDVKKYQDIYRIAETLMRTDTPSGYADALTRLQSISFIPQAREKAAFCEQRIEALRRSPRAGLQRKTEDGGHDTAVGVVVLVLLVVFFLGALACVGWLLYRLFRGELTQTQVIVTAVVAAVFVLLLIVGKLRAS